MHRAAQGFDPVARLEVGRDAKLIHDPRHGFVVEHAGDAVGYGGHDFAAPAGGKVGQHEINDGSSHVCKRVAVEEEKRGAAMALPQEFYGFLESGDFALPASPLCFKRSIAL